jgi:hypothetical protein
LTSIRTSRLASLEAEQLIAVRLRADIHRDAATSAQLKVLSQHTPEIFGADELLDVVDKAFRDTSRRQLPAGSGFSDRD